MHEPDEREFVFPNSPRFFSPSLTPVATFFPKARADLERHELSRGRVLLEKRALREKKDENQGTKQTAKRSQGTVSHACKAHFPLTLPPAPLSGLLFSL